MVTTAGQVPRGIRRAAATPLLLDQFLPSYDISVTHAQVVRATPQASYRAARNLDLMRDPVIRVLLRARALPQRLVQAGQEAGAAPAPRSFRADDMASLGWLLLGEEPGTELVLGRIGQPWKLADAAASPLASADEFAGFATPGFAKIALSLRASRYGTTSSILTLQTRMAATDAGSLGRLTRYWAVISPFGGLVRRLALRLAAAEFGDAHAQQGGGNHDGQRQRRDPSGA